jgi:hypothetical protein
MFFSDICAIKLSCVIVQHSGVECKVKLDVNYCCTSLLADLKLEQTRLCFGIFGNEVYSADNSIFHASGERFG